MSDEQKIDMFAIYQIAKIMIVFPIPRTYFTSDQEYRKKRILMFTRVMLL